VLTTVGTNLTAAQESSALTHSNRSALELRKPLFLLQPACTLNPIYVTSMYWMHEAGEFCLICLSSILTTTLHSVFGFSLVAGGNFVEVLRTPVTMLHFLQAVGCLHTLVTTLLFIRFPYIAKSDYWRRRFPRSALDNCTAARTMFMKFDVLGFFENLSKKCKFN
jgi:hypothetical protein